MPDASGAQAFQSNTPSRLRRRSRLKRVMSQARRRPFLVLGVSISLVIGLSALIGPYLSPYAPHEQNFDALLQSPSWAHPFGTDDLGRDIFSRIVHGARISITVALVSAFVACTVGAIIGLAAGYAGGWTDSILMRFMDALFAFPGLVLAIAVVSMLGQGAWQAMTAIAIVAVPRFARMMRAQTLALRHAEFVTASRVAGGGVTRICLQHIVPNALGILVIQASAYAGFAVLTEASLSFLGLGVRPPAPAWGTMLRSGYQFLSMAPWMAIIPGLAISLLVLAFNLIGDGLRDLLDPRTN
jgi:peptide/nickel transport system permease protein